MHRRWLIAGGLAAAAALAPAGVAADPLRPAGIVVRAEGKVLVAHGHGAFAPVAAGTKLYPGDQVRTGADGKALLKVGRARVMLAPRSQITVRTAERVRFGLGQVFFRVLHRIRSRLEFRVETQTAVLGVRGTTFSVAGETERIKVLLKEGKVEARAKRGRLKKHKGPPPSFAEFVAEQQRGIEEMQREFEDYLAQTQREFAAFVRSIVIEGGQGLVLAGRDAWVFEMTPQDEAAFRAFETMLKEVR